MSLTWNVCLCCNHSFTSLTGTLLDDLHEFDLEKKFWIDLSGKPGAPSPRYGLGFAGAASRLYVFGGAFFDFEGEGEELKRKCFKVIQPSRIRSRASVPGLLNIGCHMFFLASYDSCAEFRQPSPWMISTSMMFRMLLGSTLLPTPAIHQPDFASALLGSETYFTSSEESRTVSNSFQLVDACPSRFSCRTMHAFPGLCLWRNAVCLPATNLVAWCIGRFRDRKKQNLVEKMTVVLYGSESILRHWQLFRWEFARHRFAWSDRV